MTDAAIIELSGIDGSGKTTLIERIMRELNGSGVPTFERSLRSTYKRVLADIATEHGVAHWKEIYRPDQVELAHALEMLQQCYALVLPFVGSGQVVVTDTYRARWLATAVMWGVEDIGPIAAVYDRLPRPVLSVHLEVDVETAYQRITSRPKGDHITKMGNPDRLRRYHEAFAATEGAISYARSRVDTNGSQDDACDEILTLVRRLSLDSGSGRSQEAGGP